jgi:hypothetical protein
MTLTSLPRFANRNERGRQNVDLSPKNIPHAVLAENAQVAPMKRFIAIARDGSQCYVVAVGPLAAELVAYRIYGEDLRLIMPERVWPTFEWVALVGAVAGIAVGLFFGLAGW